MGLLADDRIAVMAPSDRTRMNPTSSRRRAVVLFSLLGVLAGTTGLLMAMAPTPLMP